MTQRLQFALLVDVDNVTVSAELLDSIIHQCELQGNIIYGKVYGYSDRRHRKLLPIINTRGFETASTMASKKGKRSVLDLRIVVDAVRLACQNESITAFCLVTGDGDLVPLIVMLKSFGKYVVGGFLNNSDNDNVCDKLINVRQTEVVTLHESGFNARVVNKKPRENDTSILNELDELMKNNQFKSQPINQKNQTDKEVLSDLENILKSLRENS
ncbi:MAG: NYN domain-containing protein [Firmicutes bacterium]|nr:NYN domain-containing protein [Bacillota bacterium]